MSGGEDDNCYSDFSSQALLCVPFTGRSGSREFHSRSPHVGTCGINDRKLSCEQNGFYFILMGGYSDF